MRPIGAGPNGSPAIREFDARAMFQALDAERRARGLTWKGVASEIWEMSWALNARRQSHPIAPSTLTGIAKRGDTTCQHALFILRWLGRSPESFLGGDGARTSVSLPPVGPGRRLRWDLAALYEAVDARRKERELTWADVARELRCTPSQVTGLKRARFATGMRLAMNIVQWLDRPSSDFIDLARW